MSISTVAEIRQLKTHGEKRVRVVLEVFYLVHEMLVEHRAPSNTWRCGSCPNSSCRSRTGFSKCWNDRACPRHDEVRERLTVPLLNQIQIDAGATIHELSAGRLGINGPPQSVRQQAKTMGVTRARVYQLLEDCSRVMEVRWPEGQQLLAQLEAKFQSEATSQDDLRLFRATQELFFPGKYRLEDEEPAAIGEEELV